MLIAVDLDEVLCDFIGELIKYYNELNNTNYNKSEMFSYHFWKVWGGDQKSTIKLMHDFHKTKHFENIKPIKTAKDVLLKLKNNNKLIVITARQSTIEKQTKSFVEEHFPNIFDDVILANHYGLSGDSKSKKHYCDLHNVDVLIEDSADYANECVNDKRKVFLINYPWNINREVDKRIVRVDSWQEILTHFHNL